VGDLARADRKALAQRFGAHGLRLSQLAHGEDGRAVNPDQGRKSISSETTFNTDIRAYEALEDQLAPLCEKVARIARAQDLAGRVVTLKLKSADFRIVTRRRALPAPTQTARTLFAIGRDLLRGEANGQSYRLIGIGLTGLGEPGLAEDDLFRAGEGRQLAGERTADAIRAKFGAQAVTSGRALRSRGAREPD